MNSRRAHNYNISHVGTRRQNQNNFNSNAAQLTPQKPGVQQQQQVNKQQQMKQQPQAFQAPIKTEPATPSRPVQAPPPQPPAQQPPVQPVVTPAQTFANVKPEQTPTDPNQTDEKPEGEKKKRFWSKQRLPKKEIQRRRNIRLAKLLQPKNALMVYNELFSKPEFEISEHPTALGMHYKATTTIDGVQISEIGKTKALAKNFAAESAIKHLMKNKKLSKIPKSLVNEDGTEKMDTTDGSEDQATVPWQHVASFALFKLFSSWEHGLNLFEREKKEVAPVEPVQKPAKKLPDNAAEMNPIMLLNQMCPNATFEELPSTGQLPPTFSYRCMIENKPFVGSGSSKKLAKREAAFIACANYLGVQYPKEVFNPTQ